MVPQGLPETDVAARLFTSFRELYGLFQRLGQEAAQRMQDKVNRNRHLRTFDPGEIVFRRMPGPARLPKRLFPDPSSGPYVVVRQPTDSSVVLARPDGEPVDEGRRIPLAQIIAGPRRAGVQFDEPAGGDCRSLGTMLSPPGAEQPSGSSEGATPRMG